MTTAAFKSWADSKSLIGMQIETIRTNGNYLEHQRGYTAEIKTAELLEKGFKINSVGHNYRSIIIKTK